MSTITALRPSFPSLFSSPIPWALSISNPIGWQPISVSDCLLTVVLMLLPLLDPLHQQVGSNLPFNHAHHRISGCGADCCSSSHSNHVCLPHLSGRFWTGAWCIVSWKSSTLRGGWETMSCSLSDCRMPLFCHFCGVSADGGRGSLSLRRWRLLFGRVISLRFLLRMAMG